MDVKQAVSELFEAAKARTVRFPKGSDWNEAKVRQTCGATLLSVPRKEDGSLDVDCALATMIEQYGVEKESEADQKKRKAEDEAEDDAVEGEEGGSPSKKKGKKPKDPPKKETVEVEANRTVAYAFQEMADIYWKNGERMKGGAYSKVRRGRAGPASGVNLFKFPCHHPRVQPVREGDPRVDG